MNGTFSKRFKELREEKSKTQQELLDEFNKNYHYNFKKSSISMYENSKRMPEIQALTDFADYFNVSVDFLLGISDTRNPYNRDNEDTKKQNPNPLLEKIENLSPESIEELEKYMELLKIKEQMDKCKDETSSTLEKDA